MTDTGQDIEVPDTMTIRDLYNLRETTESRFYYRLDNKEAYAYCTWRNYEKKSGKRIKDENGAWKLLPIEKKLVGVV